MKFDARIVEAVRSYAPDYMTVEDDEITVALKWALLQRQESPMDLPVEAPSWTHYMAQKVVIWEQAGVPYWRDDRRAWMEAGRPGGLRHLGRGKTERIPGTWDRYEGEKE